MIIEINGKKYESTDAVDDMPCLNCDMRILCNTREFQTIKKQHGAITCFQLIGMKTFKLKET